MQLGGVHTNCLKIINFIVFKQLKRERVAPLKMPFTNIYFIYIRLVLGQFY